jgi:hypothetical protein
MPITHVERNNAAEHEATRRGWMPLFVYVDVASRDDGAV